MSLAFDAAKGSTSVTQTGSGTVSWTHTPVGTPVVATVNVQWVADANNGNVISISGITYGGVAMTQVGTQVVNGVQNQEKWVLLAPASGAQTVSVTWLDSSDPNDAVVGVANSMTYTSAGTATYGTLQTATGASSPITKAVTSVASTSTLDTMGGVNNGASAAITITVNGTSETKRSGVTNYGNGTNIPRGQVYNSTQTGTGTVTANATESASRNWGIMVLELQEVLSTASGDTLLMMGI